MRILNEWDDVSWHTQKNAEEKKTNHVEKKSKYGKEASALSQNGIPHSTHGSVILEYTKLPKVHWFIM